MISEESKEPELDEQSEDLGQRSGRDSCPTGRHAVGRVDGQGASSGNNGQWRQRYRRRDVVVIPSQRQVRMFEQTLDNASTDGPRWGASAEAPAFATGSSLNGQPKQCCVSSLRSSASNGPVRVPAVAVSLVCTITSECATAGCRPTCDSPSRPDHGPCITCRRRSRLHRSPTASLLPTLTS